MTPGAKGKVSHIPRVHPGCACACGDMCTARWGSRTLELTWFILCHKNRAQSRVFLCQFCSLCWAVPQTGPRQSRNHSLADRSCCQVVSIGGVTMGVEVRAHCCCGEIASESLKLVHLVLTCCRKRLGDYRSTYICRSYSEIGA